MMRHTAPPQRKKLDSGDNIKETSVWQKTHDNTLLPAKHRLYLSATPKIYEDKAKNKAKEKAGGKDILLYSMDDLSLFGEEIYSLRFHQAIDQGLLSDYRVIISFMREEAIAEYLGKLTKAKENSKLNIQDTGKMIAFAKALKKADMCFIDEDGRREAFADDKSPMSRAVAFHPNIKNSKFVKENFHAIDQEIETEHIDGQDNASIKAKKLSWIRDLGEVKCRVLNNAKCLTEGIDVPNLDAVAFFDKRDSVVDIVQAVGRAIRKAEGKKYGYIILPLVLSEKEIEDYKNTLKSSKFKIVWYVLNALRSHDERLIDRARIDQVMNGTEPNKRKDPQDLPEMGLFSIQELFSEFKNAIPKNLGDLQYWENYSGKVGNIIHALILRISALEKSNPEINKLFKTFSQALQSNLNGGFKVEEAIALIAQHIITKPIFDHIFPLLDFAKFDKVSAELTKLYEKLLELGLDSKTKELEKFYASVRENAEYAQSDKSKQALIKNLYR